MSEYISIHNQQDIDRFLTETNGLHDGYIISVQYCNNGIKPIDGGHEFDTESTELHIRILVTSIFDAVVELYFSNIIEWQIKDNQFDITDTAVSLADNGSIVWADDHSTEADIRNSGSYVIARNMKWRIE